MMQPERPLAAFTTFCSGEMPLPWLTQYTLPSQRTMAEFQPLIADRFAKVIAALERGKEPVKVG